MNPGGTPTTTIRIPLDIKRRAKAKAAEKGTTLSTIVVNALYDYASGYPWLVPTKVWRVTGPDGVMHAESSNEAEIRGFKRPGDRLERLWRAEILISEWREES